MKSVCVCVCWSCSGHNIEYSYSNELDLIFLHLASAYFWGSLFSAESENFNSGVKANFDIEKQDWTPTYSHLFSFFFTFFFTFRSIFLQQQQQQKSVRLN